MCKGACVKTVERPDLPRLSPSKGAVCVESVAAKALPTRAWRPSRNLPRYPGTRCAAFRGRLRERRTGDVVLPGEGWHHYRICALKMSQTGTSRHFRAELGECTETKEAPKTSGFQGHSMARPERLGHYGRRFARLPARPHLTRYRHLSWRCAPARRAPRSLQVLPL